MNDYGARSFPMLWDSSFQSWSALGIAGQPAWMVVGPDGRLIDGAYGEIPEDDVLELTAALKEVAEATANS